MPSLLLGGKNMAEYTRVNILLSGRVQGVLFRKYAQKKAKKLSITGWVHNLLDGRVEIECEGEVRHMEEFILAMKRGPQLANVKEAETTYKEYKGEWKEFEIREFGF